MLMSGYQKGKPIRTIIMNIFIEMVHGNIFTPVEKWLKLWCWFPVDNIEGYFLLFYKEFLNSRSTNVDVTITSNASRNVNVHSGDKNVLHDTWAIS